ncbi:MAG: RagB/SusD family nutrient uptake outer membrane protein, partial [Bacteroidales bacterium]|nr:RagB/SusD family nutrient uptake outer membrane protein [Bacteroidales bacterium]
MRKINILLTAVLALFVFAGCNDEEFLKENPKYFYTTDNAFSTSEQVDQALVACYSHIRAMYCAEANVSSYAFRDGNGTDMFDIPTIRLGNRFNDYGILNADHNVFYTVYSWWYQLIAKANLAMYAAELPQISWASAQDKAYAIAQAKFFRAWCYRNLGELFGGVPLVDEITTTPRYDFVRASRVETYQFAIDDLEGCLNDFPETTNTPGRLVRGAAQHTLCQLYLDKGLALEDEGKASDAKAAYSKAIEYGNALINGST